MSPCGARMGLRFGPETENAGVEDATRYPAHKLAGSVGILTKHSGNLQVSEAWYALTVVDASSIVRA